MSFNLRYREADDGANGWDRRKALALARIRAFDPDLLGIQECSAGPQAAYLRRHLRDWTFQGVRTEDADWPVEMAPILFRSDAFETIATGHFWLSETPACCAMCSGRGVSREQTKARSTAMAPSTHLHRSTGSSSRGTSMSSRPMSIGTLKSTVFHRTTIR